MFIVIEGMDGCGKSTAARLLADKLQASVTRCPNGYIRDLLLNPDYKVHPMASPFLFTADMIEMVQNKVVPALEDGNTLITDRYIPSTFAYQLTQPWVTEKDYEKYLEILKYFLPKPTVTFILDCPLAVCLERSAARVGEYKKADTYEQAEMVIWQRRHTAYASLKPNDPVHTGVLVRLDSYTHTPDELVEQMEEFIKSLK